MRTAVASRPFVFVAVGCVAAAVHVGSVFLLVDYGRMSPSLANVPAFFCAFVVSFTGHSRHTFRTHAKRNNRWWRWLQVSIAGFLLNQGLYLIALRAFPQVWYVLLLVIVNGAVAGISYVLGKTWVFSV